MPATPDRASIPSADPRRAAGPGHTALDVGRGALIGCVEIVPGVSGGTVALITGVYHPLIASAAHVVSGARSAATGAFGASRQHLAKVNWRVVLPVLAGMVVALLLATQFLEPVITDHPVGARAVFFGLVLASVVVPMRMVSRWTPARLALAAAMAVAAFALTGLPAAASVDPPLLVVAAAAAVAICALVLPGVSGSFLLLTFGLYEVTLAAVSDRDLAYLAAFAVGAAIGLGSFVRVLQHLLTHRADLTLSIMSGLMVGSLRALWPWQGDDRTLLAPGGDVLPMALLVLAGMAAVGALLVVQARLQPRP